jgi:hypothetical protein
MTAEYMGKCRRTIKKRRLTAQIYYSFYAVKPGQYACVFSIAYKCYLLFWKMKGVTKKQWDT